jgi:predicted ferric reductase
MKREVLNAPKSSCLMHISFIYICISERHKSNITPFQSCEEGGLECTQELGDAQSLQALAYIYSLPGMGHRWSQARTYHYKECIYLSNHVKREILIAPKSLMHISFIYICICERHKSNITPFQSCGEGGLECTQELLTAQSPLDQASLYTENNH